jgi:hypothetical protein
MEDKHGESLLIPAPVAQHYPVIGYSQTLVYLDLEEAAVVKARVQLNLDFCWLLRLTYRLTLLLVSSHELRYSELSIL